jgi:hypothetical protein
LTTIITIFSIKNDTTGVFFVSELAVVSLSRTFNNVKSCVVVVLENIYFSNPSPTHTCPPNGQAIDGFSLFVGRICLDGDVVV